MPTGATMFGKDKPSQDGAEARGVIVEARPGNLMNRHGERRWHLRVRVKFEDGQSTESECELFDLGIGAVGPASGLEPYPLTSGTVIPVRYDPNDRTRVSVDREKMIEDTKAAYEANRQKKIARAEASLAPPSSVPQPREDDESYLMDALTAAQAKGDAAEVQRLTQRLEQLIGGG
jgi:hypothetical protein